MSSYLEFTKPIKEETMHTIPNSAAIGTQYKDIQLGKPLWWDGDNWVDWSGGPGSWPITADTAFNVEPDIWYCGILKGNGEEGTNWMGIPKLGGSHSSVYGTMGYDYTFELEILTTTSGKLTIYNMNGEEEVLGSKWVAVGETDSIQVDYPVVDDNTHYPMLAKIHTESINSADRVKYRFRYTRTRINDAPNTQAEVTSTSDYTLPLYGYIFDGDDVDWFGINWQKTESGPQMSNFEVNLYSRTKYFAVMATLYDEEMSILAGPTILPNYLEEEVIYSFSTVGSGIAYLKIQPSTNGQDALMERGEYRFWCGHLPM